MSETEIRMSICGFTPCLQLRAGYVVFVCVCVCLYTSASDLVFVLPAATQTDGFDDLADFLKNSLHEPSLLLVFDFDVPLRL